MVAPMSAGVGIADFAPVAAAAPTSLAYSGSTAGPLPAVGMRRDLPERHDAGEDQQRQQRRPQAERVLQRRHGDQLRLMAKLSTYSLGLAGSNALPMTTMVFFDGSGGVSPISFIMLAVSVAR